jgi:hypothetical protein
VVHLPVALADYHHHWQPSLSHSIPWKILPDLLSSFHFGFCNNNLFTEQVLMSASDRVAQLYPEGPGFLSVTFYDLQDMVEVF